ncbi:lipopolysaccharide biosynthesis protein [Bacteroides oleiciplenus]|uniref:lipopolysaccharide biosynthesis protein n=1 Tax=Bacteroides oleiciplenus TaxID=626931 RepID=UPI0026DCB895|nr:hypothetical protein [Bacteroides oleiciplenus]
MGNIMVNDKNKLAIGVAFFAFFSFLSLPLGYVRNWLLSSISIEFVSAFASINIFIGLVNTFFVFGATNVYSTFLPKIKDPSKQSQFVFSSYLNSAILMILMSVFFFLYYSKLPNNIIGTLQISNWLLVFFFIIFYGFGQTGVNTLIGLREYKLSAILNSAQILFVTVFLLLIIIGLLPKFVGYEFNTFLCLIGSVWCFVFVIFLCYFVPRKGFHIRYYLPKGYWSQAFFVHLGTILTFLYGYADQILVLGYLGEMELAQYFLIVQIASLITFLPIRLGNVFQSGFSTILADNTQKANLELTLQYNKIARYILLLTFLISSILVLFNREILSIFSNNLKLNSLCFLLLVIRYFIGSLGNIHSMIIISKEKNLSFFLMNTYMVIIQIVLSLVFVRTHGVLGIVVSFIISTIIAQLNLAYLLVKKCRIQHFDIKILFVVFLLLIVLIFLSFVFVNIFARIALFVFAVFIVVRLLKTDIFYLIKMFVK